MLGEKIAAIKQLSMGLIFRAVPDAEFAAEIDDRPRVLSTAPTKRLRP